MEADRIDIAKEKLEKILVFAEIIQSFGDHDTGPVSEERRRVSHLADAIGKYAEQIDDLLTDEMAQSFLKRRSRDREASEALRIAGVGGDA